VKWGFTGHQFEARTQNWGTLHRYLDSREGRWTQRDPAGSIDTQNRYGYVGGRPLSSVDRLGLWPSAGFLTASLTSTLDPTGGDYYSHRIGATFNASFTAIPNAFCKGTTFGFIQVVSVNMDGKSRDYPAIVPSIRTHLGYFVDEAPHLYGVQAYANPSGPGEPPSGNTTWFHDSPLYDAFIWPSTYDFRAETIYVATAPGGKAKFVAGVDWEWHYRAARIWHVGPTQIQQPSPWFIQALHLYLNVFSGLKQVYPELDQTHF
jgi:RHS repeat-associated protein